MNFAKVYDQLMNRGRTRVIYDDCIERHHIVPKCLGGSDEADNLVDLTPREHFIAHQLLHRIHPHHTGLHCAVATMSGRQKLTSRLYDGYRRAWSERRKGWKPSDEHRQAISAFFSGKPQSEEHKLHKANAKRGKKVAQEGRDNISNSLKGRTLSEEHKKKLSVVASRQAITGGPNKGRKFGEETSAKHRERLKTQREHKFIARSYYIDFTPFIH